MLVLGTSNTGKIRELRDLLAPLGVELRSLDDFPQAIAVEESGDSFAANARIKAVGQAKHLRQWVLGEDSGLSVDALAGRPGIYSARYAGPSARDHENNAKLLEELGTTPLDRRGAHYECHVVVADPQGNIRAEARGQCHGRIALEPAGRAGFGYDPLFEIIEYHRTAAQLGEVVKSVLSHRARAVEVLRPQLYPLAAVIRG